MGYRIGTNVASLTAQRQLSKAQRLTENSMRSIASGSRVDDPANDAAGFAISEGLKAQLSGLRQAKFNAEGAMAFIQTAEGSLNDQNNILIRLRELSVLAASDTVGENERGFLNEEFQQLSQEFDRIAKTARFGDKQLLVGSDQEFEFHVGANKGEENKIRFKLEANTTAENVGISDIDISDQDSAGDALESIDDALSSVLSARATFGSAQSRFQFAIDNLATQAENIDAARSVIADVDLAEEVTNLAKGQILTELGTSILAQANANANKAYKLIG